MSIPFLLLLLFSLWHRASLGTARDNWAVPMSFEKHKTYIVHVHPKLASSSPEKPRELEEWYKSFLPSAMLSSGEFKSRLIYSYSSVISGFAARLTDEELADVKKKAGFVHAYPDRLVRLQTTHTPQFLGLQHNYTTGFWKDSNFGKGVIVGVLDTGVLPSHPSFDDEGMPPPPEKWKGSCEFTASSCNNKLIGAKRFAKGASAMHGFYGGMKQDEPFDDDGHGTHTAATAAGMFVDNADVLGQAAGTAVGMAPYAHLAVYKVCNSEGCTTSDILAGLDSAVEDGVDVLSLSISGGSYPFYDDGIAIGSFRAIENGIFVSCAAGNSGPFASTLSNEAPWILTVGAGTMDRSIRSVVELGNGDQFVGEALYQSNNVIANLPLVYPGFLAGSQAATCKNESLASVDVKGKVVLCDTGEITRVAKGENVKSAGGAAMILANSEAAGFTTLSDIHVLPASHVSYADGLKIKSYIKSASNPTTSIAFEGTVLGTSPAPMVGYFSSRGPNQADPNILKPDIIGPGVNVLAAWPFPVGTSGAAASFNIISGTSMATPHLSGIAALLKSAHPDWSPAAIKSAIMTTADRTANDGKLIRDQSMEVADFYAVGSGHVNPTKANEPGLVYDMDSDDYIAYLCGLQYTDEEVSIIVGHAIECSGIESISGAELNYPSFVVFLSAENEYKMKVTRTVTNVGAPGSEYAVNVTPPSGVLVTVEPKKLSFSEVNEKAQYTVTFSGKGKGEGTERGFLTWVSSAQNTSVTGPITVSVA
ncbi:subtilisin-like protease 4 [Elaeis guineensis]|uniref:Subtilisin-like protease SBT1.2 n=1 Tax=Elaeis guineensis var. tenera TaxID=51953 RepID=A0A6I9SGJ5_ELAGV|nr:subtilisin-like protease SBT1.2 [Elaeis guineensis]